MLIIENRPFWPKSIDSGWKFFKISQNIYISLQKDIRKVKKCLFYYKSSIMHNIHLGTITYICRLPRSNVGDASPPSSEIYTPILVCLCVCVCVWGGNKDLSCSVLHIYKVTFPLKYNKIWYDLKIESPHVKE